MSVQYITREEARRMVLERLRQWVASLPPAERMLKIVWGRYILSPSDMVREVELGSEVGWAIVAAELRKISETVGVTYIVSG
ncbi:MAG: hypothetical protein QXO67_00400 [Candidatus Bathyarchaeia archaeon]